MLRIVKPGRGPYGSLYVRIEIKRKSEYGWALSISGVEGPLTNGDCRGSAGQCIDAIDRLTELAPGWTPEAVKSLKEVWERWHMNDMRAGCEHQRKIDTRRTVEVVTYGITHEAQGLRDATRRAAANAALKGEPFTPEPTARALAELDDWYADRFKPFEADSPLAGCFEVKKREWKAIGWVRPDDHPEGMLGAPCPECGYRYGTKWLFEPLPNDVRAFLCMLPEAPTDPPGRWLM